MAYGSDGNGNFMQYISSLGLNCSIFLCVHPLTLTFLRLVRLFTANLDIQLNLMLITY